MSGSNVFQSLGAMTERALPPVRDECEGQERKRKSEDFYISLFKDGRVWPPIRSQIIGKKLICF